VQNDLNTDKAVKDRILRALADTYSHTILNCKFIEKRKRIK